MVWVSARALPAAKAIIARVAALMEENILERWDVKEERESKCRT
jgi:hypothetical protein